MPIDYPIGYPLSHLEHDGETPSFKIWTIRHGWRREGYRDEHTAPRDSKFFDLGYDVTIRYFFRREVALEYAEELVAASKNSDWAKNRLRPVELTDWEKEFDVPPTWRSRNNSQYLTVEPIVVE